MHLHFLGICGTFMGSLAILAREMGHQVSGSDRQVYPPMSSQLERAGIQLHEGFDYNPTSYRPDLVIVGNVMRRGLPCVEALLNSDLPYTSGPQWLHDHLLQGDPASGRQPRWVLAVAGTHGKTTTASLLAWLLEDAGFNPGFLIGGVPGNFPFSARLGSDPFFVIEADEYDTAFFDKRSKFVHYLPRTLILNNLEYDHADIFPDLAAIQTQFHHLMRLLPEQGQVILPADDPNLDAVVQRGCWSGQVEFTLTDADQPQQQQGWEAFALNADASCFSVAQEGRLVGQVRWSLAGRHNVRNALAAVAAAHHAGIASVQAVASLNGFKGVKRRLELLGEVQGVRVYDDFAHHPTAIQATLQALRPACSGRLIAVIEPRSNTMQLGTLRAALAPSVALADQVYWYQSPAMRWSPAELQTGQNFTDLSALQAALLADARPGDWWVLMSNGSFGGLHQALLAGLQQKKEQV